MAKQSKEKKASKVEEKAPAEQLRLKGPRPRLKEKYRNEILPRLMDGGQYSNRMAVPRLRKIVINMGTGEASRNIKVLDMAMDELGRITGQKPVLRRARKAISSFKLRAGMPIGACVTLRGDMMYEFLDRLISIALPRVRDFRGLNPDSFDGRGNYTMGLKDQLIFPEVDYAKVDQMRGMNVTVVTSAETDEEAKNLLTHLGLPFRKQ